MGRGQSSGGPGRADWATLDAPAAPQDPVWSPLPPTRAGGNPPAPCPGTEVNRSPAAAVEGSNLYSWEVRLTFVLVERRLR